MEQLTNDERIILLDTLIIDALTKKVSELTGENIEYIQWSVVDSAARHSASMSDYDIINLIASIREDHQIAWNNAIGESIITQLVNEVAKRFKGSDRQ